jgi:hypothetical protein
MQMNADLLISGRPRQLLVLILRKLGRASAFFCANLRQFKPDSIFDFAWSRDGKWLALDRGRISRDVVLLTDTANTKQANSN